MAARILLAEDEEIISSIIEEILVAEGHEIDACPDGQTAWERLKEGSKPYDVTLLERQMPGMEASDRACRPPHPDT
jgi:two-component system, cell cycle response regulator CpdR